MIEALTTAQNDRWGHVEELLATIAEELDAVIRVLIMANSDPKRKPKLGRPFHYPRPGQTIVKRRELSAAEIRQRFGLTVGEVISDAR